ncbi:alpha-hydroxy-acid oxidizing enzyme [Parafrankia colletiae]|uniref:Alpha-hydroxy-acid oxidizing enzyme n=1 Tax=Parafrankia colletiae TaxID=573497 RepID=A0A1S1QW61_9ACTN|nr:alpha-hydroxy acid oxidase [Parafrankia colletiae]MCK9902489.1 alpha-hydroxy-acid oxidizing protein [Frankia sp. Cpl3]OHV37789.1 alpha-hydroxy-acid oxidizing enzyme [Parafrankia colletiae]
MTWVDELEQRAAARLPRDVYDYFRQGAGADHTLGEATPAWDAVRLRPRVLRDVTEVHTATTVLGTPVETPVLVAPTAAQHVVEAGGVVATARGTAKAGSLICVSCLTDAPYTEVRDASPAWWAQVYVLRDRAVTRDLVARAVEAGAGALVLTVDTPVLGDRPYPYPYPYPWPGSDAPWYGGRLLTDIAPEDIATATDVTFDDIGWLREISRLPVVVKGILRADDAVAAVQAGARGVVVSNHGGRQLDAAVPTATALPEIAQALAGSGAETYVDGGLRGGVHVLAALALGARAVLIGRPTLWALAAGSADGVHHLLETMTGELRRAMTLVGARGIDELTPDLVERAG